MNFWDWVMRRPASAVLIDMPNVENEGRSRNTRRFSIVWKILRTAIEKELRGTTSVIKTGFHRPDRNRAVVERWKRQALPHWQRQNYDLVTYYKRDIDSGISYWMYRAAKKARERGAKHLKIVLVSGDALYGEVFQALQEDYRGKLKIELVIYAWGVQSLSRDLALLAGPRNIRYLDQIPGLIRGELARQKPTR